MSVCISPTAHRSLKAATAVGLRSATRAMICSAALDPDSSVRPPANDAIPRPRLPMADR